jgi:hypothetical protein
VGVSLDELGKEAASSLSLRFLGQDLGLDFDLTM